jgi:anti-anti-sigma regulatory factor
MGMNLFTLQNSATAVVRINDDMAPGDLAGIKNEIRSAAAFREILVDLRDLLYLGKEIMDFLLDIKNDSSLNGCAITILNPNDVVMHMLTIRNFDQLFDIRNIYPTAW